MRGGRSDAGPVCGFSFFLSFAAFRIFDVKRLHGVGSGGAGALRPRVAAFGDAAPLLARAACATRVEEPRRGAAPRWGALHGLRVALTVCEATRRVDWSNRITIGGIWGRGGRLRPRVAAFGTLRSDGARAGAFRVEEPRGRRRTHPFALTTSRLQVTERWQSLAAAGQIWAHR